MKPMMAAAGDTIIKQGDPGDLFYCLEKGSASAVVDGVGQVMTYEDRGCFGELALLYNSPRAASIVAISSCHLWTIDVRTFKYILTSTSSSTMATRCAFLKKCPFLESLTVEQISRLAEALEITYHEQGEVIVRQGDAADSFYILEEGIVRCTQVKSSGREFELITLRPGDYFGEMALILHEARHANCIAESSVKCLSLNSERFDLLLGHARQHMARRMRIRILQSVPLLSKLSETKLMKFASVMKVQAFADGTYIIREGEEGSRFYIVAEGEARCTVTQDGVEQEVARFQPQQYFGERALVAKEARVANVIAVGTVECLVLDRDSFNQLLADVHDDINEEIARRGLGDIIGKRDSELSAPTERTAYLLNDLTPLKTVGTGTFGRVKIVRHTSGSMYALKCMSKQEIVQLHQERNTMNEKILLFECSASPFVLKLYQTFNTPHQIFMLMEFIQGGELWSYIYESKMKGMIPREANNSFTLHAVKFYAANVILAYQHVHGLGIAYRDLKPENLLLDHQGYVKVIDFGFAKKLPYRHVNGTTHDKTFTVCGTPEYLSPEIIMSKGYDKAADYWALGCFIYEMTHIHTPFQAEHTSKIFQKVMASEKHLVFKVAPNAEFQALVKSLLTPNPAFRLGNLNSSVVGIMEHAFFKDFDWKAIYRKTAPAPYVPVIKDSADSSNFGNYGEDKPTPEYKGPSEHFADF
jgi:cGMP-dependent protein kinase